MREIMRIVESGDQPDERLGRAKAMGFDTDEPIYHGTRAGEFPAFRVNYRKNEQLGFGIHVTPDENFAGRYAHDGNVGRRGKSPYVFAGFLRKGRVLDADALVREGSPEFALGMRLAGRKAFVQKDENGVPCLWMQNAIDATDGKRAERLIRDAGYDTIRYKAAIKTRTPYGAQTSSAAVSYVVLNPANLRRADAAFNPDRADSADLLD